MTEDSHSEPENASRFQAAIATIDAANAEDPRTAATAQGCVPYELLYGQRMSAMLRTFKPEATEVLQLAARAQHIERWHIPRAQFPEGRDGYHRWRNALMEHHADATGGILAASGYKPEFISRVQSLLRKENLRSDAEAQALEDLACLVFLENYLVEFAGKQGEQKLIGILQRTLRKMSAEGRKAALALSYPKVAQDLIRKALVPDPAEGSPL